MKTIPKKINIYFYSQMVQSSKLQISTKDNQPWKASQLLNISVETQSLVKNQKGQNRGIKVSSQRMVLTLDLKLGLKTRKECKSF